MSKRVSGTIKQKRVARELAKELAKPAGAKIRTKKEIMLASGFSSTSATKHSATMLNSAGVQLELAKLGVTADKMAKVYDDAMQAKVVSSYRGEVIESDVPDHSMRLKAADKLAELTGIKQKNIKVTKVNYSLNKDDLQDLLGIV